MDQNSRNHHQHPLGVNRLGKSIRKSPLHQSNFHKLPPEAAAAAALPPQPPQPQVYNISKSDFRSIVQQLTGSPARDPANITEQARPPQPKPPSSRLMRIRPPPLTPISRPPPLPLQASVQIPNPNSVLFQRPADSPVSAYMKYLESSLLSADSSKRTPAQGLLPLIAPLASPSGNPNHPVTFVPVAMQPGLLPSPGSHFSLPSPNSLLPLPSPSSFLNLVSPKSPYAPISPGFQYSQPFGSNFFFSPMSQSGILGPGPGSQPPASPSMLFPPSPSGFLPLLSPRWREM